MSVTHHNALLVLAGLSTALAFVAGLFFWRFWRTTRDRFFAYFAFAFWVLAIEKLLAFGGPMVADHHPAVYLLRIFSFGLIAVAVLEKNRQPRS